MGFEKEVEVVCIAGCHNDLANRGDEADDDLPSMDELLAFSSKGISTDTRALRIPPSILVG